MGASILGKNIETGNLVALEQDARLRGLYVIGKTGSGKTTLLINLIVQDIQAGRGVCFIEPHGDAIDTILAYVPAHRQEDVILLDPLDKDYPFGLNLYACADPTDDKQESRTVNYVMEVFAKLFADGDITFASMPQMAQVLRNTARTLIANPGTTMAEIPLLLQDEEVRTKLIKNVTNPQVQLFWNRYNRMKPQEQAEFSSSTINRIDAFLSDALILRIIGQATTTINFREVMDSGKILLVKLSREYPQLTSLIGSIIIGQIANAAFSRVDTPEDQRVQFNLYADEYQRFSTPTFAELLAEVRKFKIATCVAHQWRGQLDHANKGATLNTANLVVYQVSGEDAEELAKQFDATPPQPEIIGYRPILTPKRNVLEHLLRNGHTNPKVTHFTATYLVKAYDLLERHKAHHYFTMQTEKGFWDTPPIIRTDDLRKVLNQVNELLFSCMRDRTAEKPIPAFVLAMFAMINRFEKGIGRYEYKKMKEPVTPTKFQAGQVLLQMCEPAIFQHAQLLQQQVPYAEQFADALRFITAFHETMAVLALDPVLVDTGQHEPIYASPRQHADVRGEIATQLANPPQAYSAHCKLGTKEYTIQAEELRARDASEIWVAKRESIIARTHERYCTKREEVSKAIAARQATLMKPEKKQQKTKQEEE